MTSISGTIRIGEATPTAKSTSRRQRGPAWQYIALMVVLWIAGAAAGVGIGRLIPFDPILAGCGGALVGLFSYPFVCRRMSVWRFRRRLTERGTPLVLRVRFEITPEAFVYEVADVRMIAKWAAVSELFYDKGW